MTLFLLIIVQSHKKTGYFIMCLIITIIMLVLSIQNLMQHQWLTGTVQLVIALGFLVLLLRNIRKARCDKNGGCDNGCMITGWIAKIFLKKEK